MLIMHIHTLYRYEEGEDELIYNIDEVTLGEA